MSEQFTKGPWFVAESDKFDHMVCTLSSSHSVYADVKVSSQPEHDAALIACAPEMYEMLKWLSVAVLKDGSIAHKNAVELLAKARGEL